MQHPPGSGALPVASPPLTSHPKLCAKVSRLPMSKEEHPLESPNSRDIFVDFSCINQVDDATENVDPFSTPSDQEEEEEEEDFEEEVEEEFEEEVNRFSNPSDHKEEEGGEEGEEEEEEEEEEGPVPVHVVPVVVVVGNPK